jgi:hypothetical protein
MERLAKRLKQRFYLNFSIYALALNTDNSIQQPNLLDEHRLACVNSRDMAEVTEAITLNKLTMTISNVLNYTGNGGG